MATMRVLVVDDDRDVAESLGMVMEGLGCLVELAFDGEEAISKYRESAFDLALMDVRMPRKNGVETFFELLESHPDAKVVMMTGYSVERLLDNAMERGALGVLRKPIDFGKLRNLLNSIAANDT